MLFDLKSVALFGLMAISSAAPMAEEHLNHLSTRAQIKDVNCAGKTFTKAAIEAQYHQALTRSGKYPAPFKNKTSDKKTRKEIPVFAGAGNGPFEEYPLKDPIWTGKGSGDTTPGIYRIVWTAKSFTGVMVKRPGTDIYDACTAAGAPATPAQPPQTTPTPTHAAKKTTPAPTKPKGKKTTKA